MKARSAIEVVAKHRGGAVAVCALGMAANEWWAVTEGEDAFYMHGAMGFAASFALGLALSLPELYGDISKGKVIVAHLGSGASACQSRITSRPWLRSNSRTTRLSRRALCFQAMVRGGSPAR